MSAKKATSKNTTAKKAPATKKAATKKAPAKKKAATKKAPAKKKSVAKKAPAKKKAGLSDEALYRKIELEAYLLAEANGFQGNPSDYWLQAEQNVKDA